MRLAWRVDVASIAGETIGTLGEGEWATVAANTAELKITEAVSGSSLGLEVAASDPDALAWNELRLAPVVTIDDVDYSFGLFSPLLPAYELQSWGLIWKLNVSDISLALDAQVSTAGDFAGIDGNTLREGASIIRTVEHLVEICGITSLDIPDPLRVLAQDRAWDLGTSYRAIINELLGSVSYYPAHVSRLGAVTSRPMTPPEETEPRVEIDLDAEGSDLEVTPQPEWLANVAVVIVEDPQRQAFGVRYTDDNPASPTSTASLGYRKLVIIKDQTIPNEELAIVRARAEIERRAAVALQGKLQIPLDPAITLYDTVQTTSRVLGDQRWIVEGLEISGGEMTVSLSSSIPTEEAKQDA